MTDTPSLFSRIVAVIWSGVLAFAVLAVASGAWGGLMAANKKTGLAIPWSVPVMALVLWLIWVYLGGRWWPHSTSESRRLCLRANPVSGRVFGWALVAGVLSIVALTGCWIVLFQLVKMRPNNLGDISRIPLLTVILLLVMSSLVSPVSEEAAFRGYCQVVLERKFPGAAAVLVSSVFFALAHLTQGFYLSKLSVYFLAGVVLGLIAYLTKSLLPGIAVHIVADLTFFTLVWPFDAKRRLVWEGGADAWFWIHVAQTVVFAALAIVAFRKVASVTQGERSGGASRALSYAVGEPAGQTDMR
ncbi:MAG TPA: CPBP family intramembrane glutamic endopeptidase [Candidatus Acidoferrales bacterium]|nr:CPBP family intramembrane glutamic endopeptidase [Candidatus Acidoferrales bacterium]